MVTKRDAVILGIFTLVLIVGCIGFAVRAVGGGREDKPGKPSFSKAGGVIEVEPAGEGSQSDQEGLGEYRIIAQRNLFQPALGPVRRLASRRSTGGPKPAVLEEIPPIPPVLFSDERPPQEETPERNEEPRPANPGGMGGGLPAFSPPGSQGQASQDKKPRVAVTGMIQIGGRWKVIVEDLQTNDKMLASVGEEAFGYRVREVDPSHRVAMLERGGRLERFGLGDNKVVKKPSAEKGAQGGGPPGTPWMGGPGGPGPGPGGRMGGPPGGMMGGPPGGRMGGPPVVRHSGC